MRNVSDKVLDKIKTRILYSSVSRHSIKQPTRCTINLIFIALSLRNRSTCFGHCCAHHQEPLPTAFAASVYRVIAGLDVLQAVVGLLVRLQCVLVEPLQPLVTV
jgi:hypothetical protein